MSGKTAEWIEVPDSLEKYPDRVGWNDGSVLLRYESDNMTMRIEDADYDDFNKIKNLSGSATKSKFLIEILSLVNESETITQLGSKVNLDGGIPDLFEFDCPNCSVDKFQVRGHYTSKHAVCISCGERLSIIISYCSDCDRKSIFAKQSVSTDKWYSCYKCGNDLD